MISLRPGELSSFRESANGRLDDWCTHFTWAPQEDGTGTEIEAYEQGQGFWCKFYENSSDEETEGLPTEPLEAELHLPAHLLDIVTAKDAFRIDMRWKKLLPEPFMVRIKGDLNIKSSVLVVTVERVERYEPITTTSYRLY